MNIFKPGDKVKRVGPSYHRALRGCYYTVDSCIQDRVLLQDTGGTYDAVEFALVSRAGLASTDWNYQIAIDLRDKASQAIKEYNEYIDKRPDVVLIKMLGI